MAPMTPTLADPIATPEQVRHLRTRGYFVADGYFDAATVAMLRREFDAFAQLRQSSDPDAPKLNQVGGYRRSLFLPQLHLINRHIRAFMQHPSLMRLCRQLIGPDAVYGYNQAIIKPPRVGGFFAWHQDAQYQHTEPMDPGFGLWLAVSRTTIANGTMWIAPGYFERGLQPHVRDPEFNEWKCIFDGQPEPKEKLAVELQPGQMLVFSRLLPHYSGPNESDETRMAFQWGYAPPDFVTLPDRKKVEGLVPVLKDGKVVE